MKFLVLGCLFFLTQLSAAVVTFSNGQTIDERGRKKPWGMQSFPQTVDLGKSVTVQGTLLVENCGGGSVDFSISGLQPGESITFSGSRGRLDGWGTQSG